tara:strand:- start:202 stop:1116 length:915 start_codon:yes stop_codon:yes gene_type:complete
MAIDKVFYNKSSADSLGWEPEWFGAKHHDEKLVSAIKKWQKQRNLTADGLCGPATYRRIWTERESEISDYIISCPKEKDQSYIICNGQPQTIDWPKVVLWDEDGGFKSDEGTYYDYSGKKERDVKMFVNHWDVCLSSQSCAKVLNKRGISVHFLIDNDGTIYQMLDTQHGAWHAGSVNKCSIGVEISNAYYTKYQSWYEKKGFGPRPVLTDSWAHGKKLKEHLGFYDVQLDALKALWKAVHERYDIPLVAPEGGDDDFLTSTKYESDVYAKRFRGFVSHYHQSRKKIDCANLDIVKMLNELRED